MSFTAQDYIALPIVLSAVAYLAWCIRRSLLQRKSGCTSCSGCPSGVASAPNVVSISPRSD